jgi:CheY-like chemotaxis protein
VPPAVPKRQPSILLVDDSQTDLRLLMEMMFHRFRLLVAFDGADGYHKAVLNRPDLILMDVRMPKMDGFAACRLLKAHPLTRPIPIIFLTAATELPLRLEGLAVGGVDYISKPFAEEEVIARVQIHLHLAGCPADTGLPGDDLDPEDATQDAVLVRAAMSYLRQHLAELPSPEDLAHRLGTNEKRLHRAFHAIFGLPVQGWLREERLHQARHLVAVTETPLTDISQHLGYSSPAHFTRVFHERFGAAPRQFRMEWRRQRMIEGKPQDNLAGNERLSSITPGSAE